MKKLELVFVITFCIFFFFISTAFLPLPFEVNRSIPAAINTRLTVHEDGSLDVLELVNLSDTARGSFVQFVLPHPPLLVSDLEITRIWPYKTVLEKVEPSDLAELQINEVWIVNETDHIIIFLKNSKRREDVSYTFQFKLQDAIVNHFDTAQLFYHCLQSGRRIRIVSWHAEVVFLDEVRRGDIVAWLRNNGTGYLHGRAGRINFDIKSKPEYDKSYLQMLLPTHLTPDNPNLSLTSSLSSIIDSEQQLDRRIKEREEARVNAIYIAMLFFLLSFLYIFRHWCKNIRCFEVQYKNKVQDTPPDIYKPAEVGLMIRYGKLNVKDLISTLFSLAVSGYITIEQYLLYIKKDGRKKYAMDYRLRLTDKPRNDLTAYEEVLIEGLLQNFSPDSTFLSLYELEKVFIHNPVAYSKFWNKWTETLKKRNIILRLFDKRISQKQRFFFHAGLLIFIVGIIALSLVLFAFQEYYHLISVPLSFCSSGLIIIVMSFLFKKRSKKSQEEYLRLMAYKRYLSDLKKYYEDKPLPSIHHFEQALPYAIAWNMESQLIMTLKSLYIDTGSKEILGKSFYKSSLESNLDQMIYKNLLFAIDAIVYKFSEGIRAIKGHSYY